MDTEDKEAKWAALLMVRACGSVCQSFVCLCVFVCIYLCMF